MAETIIDRRNKYKSRLEFDTSRDDEKLRLSKSELKNITSLVVSEAEPVKRKNLNLLRQVMDDLDTEQYQEDTQCMEYIDFINKALEARLDDHIEKSDILLDTVNGQGFSKSDDAWQRDDFVELNNGELISMFNSFSSINATKKLRAPMRRAEQLFHDYNNARPEDVFSFLDDVQSVSREILKITREVEVDDDSEDILIGGDDGYKDTLEDMYDKTTNPGSKLITGMQGFNYLFGGGLESERVYTILGLPGEGKSMTALDITHQIAHNNPNVKLKDPTKIPVAVYLTMENSSRETFNRLHAMVYDKQVDQVSREEFVRNIIKATSAGKYSNIATAIKYVQSNTATTDILYDIYDDLLNRGYEMVFIAQDYLGTINSAVKCPDSYTEYGEILKEFKKFATHMDIPLLTLGQFNRDASKIVDKNKEAGKKDLVKGVGRENTGESFKIVQNSDALYFLVKEGDQSNKMNSDDEEAGRWLGIKCGKHRGSPNLVGKSILQPYKPNSPGLVQDLGKEPVYKETLELTIEEVKNRYIKERNETLKGSILDLDSPDSKGFFDDKEELTLGQPPIIDTVEEEEEEEFHTEAQIINLDEELEKHFEKNNNEMEEFEQTIKIASFVVNTDGTVVFDDGSTLNDHATPVVYFNPVEFRPREVVEFRRAA